MADVLDVEDENILTTIFKDSFPDSWQENPDFVQYLVELSSYGADRLAREPDRLSEEKAQILAETQDLAFHNYTTFIQTADCSKEIFQDFQIIEQHLEGLLQKLPSFSEECSKVIQKAQEISSSRRMNTLTLQRHTQLLEVLEIPQLMDTCVRNGYYEEALELASHVKRLEKKHPSIPVIASIVREVKQSTQLMLNQLIQQLRTNLQLPACLRVIGFLRRMDVFTEAELRIKFLQARDSWFQSILDTIPKGDAYTHITKTIEVSRVHLFDIMTQFRAIFSDEDPLISTGREDVVNESLLFHSWVLQKISQFLSTLERDLEEGIGGRLDSILGQCMYFGLSFSRVGADFRGLLAPIFERAALRYFSVALREANKKFEENMQSYNLLGVTTTGGLPYGISSSQSGQLYPPTTLLDFYPLAAYCNHILTAFNDLRLCAPLNLACKVTEVLQGSLQEVNRVILAFHRAEETTFNTKEKDQFEQFCATYATDLLPYLNKCMQSLFPPAQLANALGMTVSEMSKTGSIGQVDLSSVLTNVNHLMPSAPPPPAVAQLVEEAKKPVTFSLDSDGEDGHELQQQQRQQQQNLPPSQQQEQASLSPTAGTGNVGDSKTSQDSSAPPSSLPPASTQTPHVADMIPETVQDPHPHTVATTSHPGKGDNSAGVAAAAEAPTEPPVLPPFASDDADQEPAPVNIPVLPSPTAEDVKFINTPNPISVGNPSPLASAAGNTTDLSDMPPSSDIAPMEDGGEGLAMTVNDQQQQEVGSKVVGAWDDQGLDLDNLDLDAVTLEGADPSIDLDLMPTPLGSEVNLGGAKDSAKQD